MKFRLAGEDKTVILVKAEVNGKGPYDFAFDTGASVTVLSKQASQELGLSTESSTSKKAHGCCGEVDLSMTKVESVKVGDVEVKDVQVAFMDLSAISKCIETPLAGIIGYSFMKDYKVIIDYPNREIFFQKP